MPFQLVIRSVSRVGEVIAPVTKKNHGQIVTPKYPGARPIMVPSPEYKRWERYALPNIAQQWAGRPPIDYPVSMTALVYRARRVGDLLNYLAAVSDALERAGVLVNDRLVVSTDGSRPMHDKLDPRVVVTLTPMAVHDPAWSA